MHLLSAHLLASGGEHLLAPLIISSNHSQLGALGGEQLSLRVEVVLHGAVQIQVILSQVRKASNRVLHAVHTVVINRVRRHLHRRATHLMLTHNRQQRMHVRRLRGGHLRRNRHTINQNLNSANQTRLHTQAGAEHRLQHVGGGGLTVRTGHRVTVGSGERSRTINQRSQRTDILAQVLSHQDRHRRLTQQLRTGSIRQNSGSTQLQRSLSKLRTVHLRTGQSHVQVLRANASGVHADTGDLNRITGFRTLNATSRLGTHLSTQSLQIFAKVRQTHRAHSIRAQSLSVAAQQVLAGCVRCGIHRPSFLSAVRSGELCMVNALKAHRVIQYSTVFRLRQVFSAGASSSRISYRAPLPPLTFSSSYWGYPQQKAESTPVHR